MLEVGGQIADPAAAVSAWGGLTERLLVATAGTRTVA